MSSVSLDFEKKFGDLLIRGGEEALPVIDEYIRACPERCRVAFDLRKLDWIGYSYTKATVRASLRRRASGEYGERKIVLFAPAEADYLEEISDALADGDMAVLALPYPEASFSEGTILGELPDHLRDTLAALEKSGPVTTAALAETIDQSVQNTNHRLRTLDDLGLIQRERVVSPSGGHEFKSGTI